MKAAVRGAPEDGAARLMLGQLHREAGDLLSAEKELLRARELGVSTPELTQALASTWFERGRYATLLEDLQIQPDWPQNARLALLGYEAEAAAAQDDPDRARRAYQQILAEDPEHVGALVGLVLLGSEHAPPAALERALAAAPDHPILLAIAGDRKFSAGDYAAAADLYRRGLAGAPQRDSLRLSLAQALLADDRRAEADRLLDEVLARTPGHGLANYLRAASALQAGDAEAAHLYGQRAVGAVPDHVPSRFVLASSAARLGVWDEAIRQLQDVLLREPAYPSAQALLDETRARAAGEPLGAALALAELADLETRFAVVLCKDEPVAPAGEAGCGQDLDAEERLATEALLDNRPRAAAQGFSEAMEAEPVARVARKRALALWLAGALDEAQHGLEAWLAVHPDDSETRRTLASLYREAGRAGAARRHLTSLIAADPEDARALAQFAQLLVDADRPRAAVSLAERAVRLAPDDPGVLATLGRVRLALGDEAAALALFQRAADTDDGPAASRVELARLLARSGASEQARAVLRGLIDDPGAVAVRERAEAMLRQIEG